jgi:hypothetical protein
MKRTLLWIPVVLVVMIASPALVSAQSAPSGPAPMGGQASSEPMMGGMMGHGQAPMMMCPMMGGGMGMMPMMWGMMGGPMMGMMSGKHDPKAMGQMLEMRGEMLKAMGEIMMKHGKAMQDEGKTP